MQDGWDSANAAQTQRWIESIYAKYGAENTLLFCSSCSGLVEHEGLRAVFDDVRNTLPSFLTRQLLPYEPQSACFFHCIALVSLCPTLGVIFTDAMCHGLLRHDRYRR